MSVEQAVPPELPLMDGEEDGETDTDEEGREDLC
jgi:hypothetical protein